MAWVGPAALARQSPNEITPRDEATTRHEYSVYLIWINFSGWTETGNISPNSIWQRSSMFSIYAHYQDIFNFWENFCAQMKYVLCPPAPKCLALNEINSIPHS